MPYGSTLPAFWFRRCGSLLPVLPAYSASNSQFAPNDFWIPKLHCVRYGVRFSRSKLNGLIAGEVVNEGSMSFMNRFGGLRVLPVSVCAWKNGGPLTLNCSSLKLSVA